MRTVERTRWAAGLPATVRTVARRWGLIVGEPFQHDGECAWVAPVRAAGTDLVLKLAWYHPEGAHEPDGLRRWQGDGVVRLHEVCAFDGTIAMLLERCVPGTSLRQVPEPEQDVIVAGLLRRLWRPPGPPFAPLSEMCDMWADGFERRLAGRATAAIDPGLARAGAALFRLLPRTAERTVLLCTDLHAGNILAAEREPWLVIDPKPYLGDPAYDVLQHLLNCGDRLAADPARLAARMAELLDLDAERVRRWLFARCVVESLGWPLMGEVAARLAPP